jgi:hypothetical protein
VTLHLRVDRSTIGAGRGVFATRPIARGEVVETCPMLVVDDEQGDALSIGAEGYVFGWGDGATALALGYGSLYNHSFTPNATTLERSDELVITALRDIAAGDEIFINYTGTGTDATDLWFEDESTRHV